MQDYVSLISKYFQPKTVLEIGSRDGHDARSMQFYSNTKENNVYVVEPNPTQCEYIRKTYSSFNLIQKAIFNKEGEMSFNKVIDADLGHIGVSSLLDRNDTFYEDVGSIKIMVDVIRGETLLQSLPEIDLCKIDVEGATYEVLESFGNSITKIKSFHLENEHREVWKGQKLYDDVYNYMTSKGYKLLSFHYVSPEKLQSDSIWILNQLVSS